MHSSSNEAGPKRDTMRSRLELFDVDERPTGSQRLLELRS